MSLRKKVYAFLVTALVVAGGGYLAVEQFHLLGGVAKAENKSTDGKDKAKNKKDETVPVSLAVAEQGPISSYIDSTGNLRALREIVVATQVDGVVQKVLAEEGDFVSKGQLLCQLDDAQFRINLELARQRLAQAKSQREKARINYEKTAVKIENARTEYERYNKAFSEGLVSETEVATRKYTLQELEHDYRVVESEIRELGHRLEELEAEIAQSELQISRTRIEAPFNGHITSRSVDVGQRIRALDPLYNLGTFSPLYADVHLSERDARQVRPGLAAQVRLGSDGAEALQGVVKRISPVVDQATGTVKVTVEIADARPGFKPGAFVRVALRTDTKADALLIPKKAVIEEDGENFVFVAESDKARRVKVILGYEHEGIVQVRSGLSAGQKVVVAGQGALKEGARINVIESSQAPEKGPRVIAATQAEAYATRETNDLSSDVAHASACAGPFSAAC